MDRVFTRRMSSALRILPKFRKLPQSVTEAALQVLQGGLPAGELAVTNPLGWERDDWVVVMGKQGTGAVRLEGKHGHTTVGQYTAEGLGFVARVPAFGTVSYRMAESLSTQCHL